MAGSETVDFGEMSAARGEIDSAANELDAAVKGLQRRVSELLENWKGHTADRYRSDWEQWHHGATDVVAALHQSVQALGIAHRAYAGTEADNAARFGQSSSSIYLNLDLT